MPQLLSCGSIVYELHELSEQPDISLFKEVSFDVPVTSECWKTSFLHVISIRYVLDWYKVKKLSDAQMESAVVTGGFGTALIQISYIDWWEPI